MVQRGAADPNIAAFPPKLAIARTTGVDPSRDDDWRPRCA